jgi:quercetin dioxygenase-like cupin family protein
MAIPHAESGQLISIRPLGSDFKETTSEVFVRDTHFEVFRLVLPKGKDTPMHKAAGIITLQSLEGEVELIAHGKTQILRQGDLVYLADAEPHAVKALTDAALLVTVVLHRR